MNRRQMDRSQRLAHQIGQRLIHREEWMRKARAVRHAAGSIADNRALAARFVSMARITNRVMVQYQRQMTDCPVVA